MVGRAILTDAERDKLRRAADGEDPDHGTYNSRYRARKRLERLPDDLELIADADDTIDDDALDDALDAIQEIVDD